MSPQTVSVSPGVTVKDHRGTQEFAPGSLFAVNVDERSRVSISSGVSLTITTATAGSSKHHGDATTATTTTLQYNSSIHLCNMSKSQRTITGLGLTWSGPQTFELSIMGAASSVSVLGNITTTTTTTTTPPPTTITTTTVHNTPNVLKVSSLDEVEVEPSPLLLEEEPAAKSKKRKLDKSSSVVTKSAGDESKSKEEDSGMKLNVTNKNHDSLLEPKLSKRQRRQLAKQKAKDLSTTVATLNGHDVEQQKDGNVTVAAAATVATKKDVSSVTQERRLAGGVLVRDLILGHGTSIQLGRKVAILYEGSLVGSGKVFDRKKTKPLEFRYGTGQVVRGLEKGLEGMRVGGQREITIPPDLAYGKQGSGLVIPPNATLFFSVELVSVGKGKIS